jgi:hypothetical protein
VNKPNGRYRGEFGEEALDFNDDPPTRPDTPIAKLTPVPHDGPVTKVFLRAELARLSDEILGAVRDALSDGRVVADRHLYERVQKIEERLDQ